MTVLGRWLERRQLDNPNIPLTSTSLVEYLGGGIATDAGVNVSEKSAMMNMGVWRAVNLISSRIASLPLQTYRTRASSTSPAGVPEEVMLPLFQDEAYPDLTWLEFLETSLVHLLLWGNAYSLKIFNERGDAVVRLLPIVPWCVGVERRERTRLNPSGKIYRVEGIQRDDPLTPAEIMHIPGLSYDGLVGLSPIAHARQAIGVGLAAEQVAAKLFDSGLLSGGYIQANVELDEAQAETIKRRWREKIAGASRSWEVAILANGLSYQPATIPPTDAQWIEARQFGVQEIARLYGIDPDHLMENSATGNTNVEQRAINLVRFGLNQWISRLEHRMSLHLCPRGTNVVFDTRGILRGDAAALAAYYTAALDPDTGWMERNEVRVELNLAPLEEEPVADMPQETPVPPPLAPVPTNEEGNAADDSANAAA